MDVAQLSPRVFACLTHNTTSNAGIILTAGGPVIVDTLNTPAAGGALLLHAAGLSAAPPVLVVNTHFHFDHVFGNQAFTAPVVAHESLAPSLAARMAAEFTPDQVASHIAAYPDDAWLGDLRVVYPHIRFSDCLTLDFGDGPIIIRHMGGHTPCLSVVHVPADGVVFASDLLFMGRTPFMRFADSIARWIEALHEIGEMDAAHIVPGHGEPATAADVARFRAYLVGLVGAIEYLIAQGKSSEEVAAAGLPRWADDRPAVHTANIERIYQLVLSSKR